MKNRIVTLLIICFLRSVIKAEVYITKPDSIPQKEVPEYLLPTIGGGLVVAGSLLSFDHDKNISGMDFTPSFDYKADEVLRFVPAMALVGMKAFGIESRTKKWSELIVRSAASTAIMGLAVESTKRLAKRVRPDESDNRSFPSGHTAAAFLTASLFAKEYGHLSPWYSVGAYGIATSTAMLRRMGDHHWMSDVMVGAGIGILSVELSYALADIYYRKEGKGIKPGSLNRRMPSSVASIYMRYVLPNTINGRYDNHQIRSRFGYGAGMEATHYFTPYIGAGGRIGITSSQMEIDGKIAESPLDHISITLGPHFRIPLLNSLQIGGHLHGGYGFYSHMKSGLKTGNQVFMKRRSGWGYEGGISVSFLTGKGTIIKLNTEYQSWSSPSTELENQGFSFSLSAGWGW